MISNQDSSFMQMAIEEGEKGRCNAPPNPWVGAIIVKNNEIIGRGYSAPAGGEHAEVRALQEAGDLAKGSTLYTTLEPCCHQGRTGPCTQALINKGVSRIVVALEDPDSRVAGKGIKELRAAGLDVDCSVSSSEAKQSLKAYLHHRRTGTPYTVLKAAISIDGRIAAEDGSSQWISGPEARRDSHKLRAESQAVIVGVDTAICDSPRLTVRDHTPLPLKQPLRVILDRTGRLPLNSPLLNTQEAPTLIFTSDLCPNSKKETWKKHGVEVCSLPELTASDVLQELGNRGILQVLVEGGTKIHHSFSPLAQELCVYIGPRIIGNSGIPFISSDLGSSIKNAAILEIIDCQQLGNSVRLKYFFKK
ncbi:MAG: riboflavin biosynthesis protein RibD [Waddliaceae bacterium]|nr:riboflavin biosynthesis protein RibD [Waddliaceae bacterium]